MNDTPDPAAPTAPTAPIESPAPAVTTVPAEPGAPAGAALPEPPAALVVESPATEAAAPEPGAAADEPIAPGGPDASAPTPTLGETAAALGERFPALFTPGAAKPIKLRIQADIQQRAPGAFTRKQLSLFLHRHTTSTAYLKALLASPQRFDLDGAPAGEVAAEHREAAAAEVERRRAIVEQRRAAGRAGRPGRPGRSDRAARGPVEPQEGHPSTSVAGVPEHGPGGAPLPAPVGGPGSEPAAPRERAAGTPHGDRPPRAPDRVRRDSRSPSQRHGKHQAPNPGVHQGPHQAPGSSAPPRTDARLDRPPRGPRPQGRDRSFVAERRDRAPPAQHPPPPRPLAEPVEPLPEDPARRERALLLRAWEGSPLTRANFCALKGLAVAEFDAQIDLAQRERAERSAAARRG